MEKRVIAFRKIELFEIVSENRIENANLLRFISAYRRYGHVVSNFNPLKGEAKM
jgi:hypothetical protein